MRIDALKAGDDAELAGLAAKIDREETYHRLHAEMWAGRLRDEPRFREAVEELWPYALGVLEPEQRPELARRVGLRVDSTQAVERGEHSRRARAAVERDDRGAPLGAGCDVVTADAGLGGARRDPRPGDPGHLARRPRRHPRRDGRRRHVRIEFTPTFLGCPALEVMRRAIEEKVAGARRRGRTWR